MDVHGRAYVKKKEMAKTQNNKCFYCSLRLDEDLTWEHLVPQSHGGCSRHRNLRIAHNKCNVLVANLPVQAKLILSDIGLRYGSDAFFIAADKIMPHSDGVLAILGSWKRARRMKAKDFRKLTPTIQRAFLEAESIAMEMARREREVRAYHQGIDRMRSLTANEPGPVTAIAA
tara:strand:- start:304 stop:822 length:519 start_codon:yes stop_codon:yes gene_type:complete